MLLVFLMKFCCVTPVGRRYPSWPDSDVYFDGFARQGNRSRPWGKSESLSFLLLGFVFRLLRHTPTIFRDTW